MTPQAIASGLSDAQKRALIRVCRTNGGGVWIECRIGSDGYGVPVDAAMRKLHEKGLIQGKSGGFETVVHTRLGLFVRAILENENE